MKSQKYEGIHKNNYNQYSQKHIRDSHQRQISKEFRKQQSRIENIIPSSSQDYQAENNRGMSNPTDSPNTSPIKSNLSSRQHILNKYPSMVSLQKSQVSLLSEKDINNVINLPRLEKSIMETVLLLRQQKIALLQKLNETIDKKNDFDREIHKIKRVQANYLKNIVEEHILTKSSVNQISHSKKWVNSQEYTPIIEKYLQLKNKLNYMIQQAKNLNQITLNQENPRLSALKSEYKKYAKMCEQLSTTLKSMNTSQTTPHQAYQQTISNLKKKIEELEAQKFRLKTQNNIWQNEQITLLKQQNQELIRQANRIIEKKKRLGEVTSIQGLKRLIEIEDSMKQQLFREMNIYKQQYQNLRKQNQQLRKILKQ